MVNEISDKVSVGGKVFLSSYKLAGRVGYRAIASNVKESQVWRQFQYGLGELAAEAGYQAGDTFEYQVTIKKK